MHFDPDAVAHRMLTAAPRCISAFMVEPADRPEAWDKSDVAVWRLACRCGCREGEFLGYPLRRYNTEYSGSAFVGPLGFQCSKCGKVTEILDTRQHGYHAEIGSTSCQVCGDGPRSVFACPHCAGKGFAVLTSFFFWPAAMDLVEDEPEEFAQVAENLFNEFVAHGCCAGCGRLTRLTDFGKL